jgi:hypothetical protein
MAGDKDVDLGREVVLVVLALASTTGPHQANEETQRLTWASAVPSGCVVHWLRGDPSVDAITQLENGTVLFPYPDEGSMALEKTRAGVQWALEQYAAPFIMRTTSSSFFDLEMLVSEILELPRNDVYRGVMGSYPSSIRGEVPFISGASAVMTRDVAALLSSIPSGDYLDLLEDVAIGHFLQLKQVPVSPCHRLDVTVGDLLQRSSYIRLKSYRSDAVTRKRMKEAFDVATALSQPERMRLLGRHDRRETFRRYMDRVDSWRIVVESRSIRAMWDFTLGILNLKRIATDISIRHRTRVARAGTYDRTRSSATVERLKAGGKDGGA